jgi:hypothetical protein
MAFDVIGDIHGHLGKLVWLQARLRYRAANDV